MSNADESTPPRASRAAPKEPTTLPELEEAVRSRLVEHGQHGAIALFNKYVAAGNAKGVTVEELQEIKAEVAAEQSEKPAKPAKAKKAK